jgi:hypothetical protein
MAEGDLVLDNNVGDPMQLGAAAHWQVVSAVVLDDLVDTLLLVDIEPILRIGRLQCIVYSELGISGVMPSLWLSRGICE